MKILLLTENYPPQKGGMAQSCDRIVYHLRKENIFVHVLHFTNKKRPFFTEKKWNGAYTAVPKPYSIEHGLNLCLTFLEQNLGDDYTSMIAFGGKFPITAINTYSKVLELPYYICFRGNDFDISLYSFRNRYFMDLAIKESKGVFVNSTDKKSKINKLFPDVKCYFTPNSIDLNEWQPLPSEVKWTEDWKKENKTKTTIGVFGFLKEKKGITFFLNSLIRSNCQQDVQLIFTGEIEETAKIILDEHNISFHQFEYTDRLGLIKYYLLCDFICIPSFYEGMPNVLLEAAALKIPLLVSNIDGMKDVIINEKNGWTFETLNSIDCARQINNILRANQEIKKEYTNSLFHSITKTYHPTNEVKNYIKVLEEEITKHTFTNHI